MTQVADKDFVYIGPRKVAVWPDELELFRFEPLEDRITMIVNPDILQIQNPLIEKILRFQRRRPGEGRRPVRNVPFVSAHPHPDLPADYGPWLVSRGFVRTQGGAAGS